MKQLKGLRPLILVTALLSTATHAQTMVEGTYVSPAGENGRGSCTLEIRSIGKSPKYGDDLYSLMSSGEGSCEWTAVGMAKNFLITGGLVTSGGYSGFVTLKWPFGPGGPEMSLNSYNHDGSVRNSESFTRQ